MPIDLLSYVERTRFNYDRESFHITDDTEVRIACASAPSQASGRSASAIRPVGSAVNSA